MSDTPTKEEEIFLAWELREKQWQEEFESVDKACNEWLDGGKKIVWEEIQNGTDNDEYNKQLETQVEEGQRLSRRILDLKDTAFSNRGPESIEAMAEKFNEWMTTFKDYHNHVHTRNSPLVEEGLYASNDGAGGDQRPETGWSFAPTGYTGSHSTDEDLASMTATLSLGAARQGQMSSTERSSMAEGSGNEGARAGGYQTDRELAANLSPWTPPRRGRSGGRSGRRIRP